MFLRYTLDFIIYAKFKSIYLKEVEFKDDFLAEINMFLVFLSFIKIWDLVNGEWTCTASLKVCAFFSAITVIKFCYYYIIFKLTDLFYY